MAGFNSLGMTLSGGVGELLAEIIIKGRSSIGYWAMNPQRFLPQQNNKEYLRDRATEIEG